MANLPRISMAVDTSSQPICSEAPDGSIMGDQRCVELAQDQRRFRKWANAGYATAGALTLTTLAFFLLSPEPDGRLALRFGSDLASGRVTYTLRF